jgi:hypothetical protein
MAILTCDICEDKLMSGSNGVATCEDCGMERINNTCMDTIEIYEATPINHDVPYGRKIVDSVTPNT